VVTLIALIALIALISWVRGVSSRRLVRLHVEPMCNTNVIWKETFLLN
jgi:hypothetical protein